jgi:hypothetical protein
MASTAPYFPRHAFSQSPDELNAVSIYFLDMPTAKHFTGPEVAVMLAAPAVLSYPSDGGVQVEKSQWKIGGGSSQK